MLDSSVVKADQYLREGGPEACTGRGESRVCRAALRDETWWLQLVHRGPSWVWLWPRPGDDERDPLFDTVFDTGMRSAETARSKELGARELELGAATG
jgi:hypothetical protein